ncbi:MAG: hypothetical protein JWM82_2069 [Myxococcales bacterium]|nr:hypothetical protein [Myxococcales bacterium]
MDGFLSEELAVEVFKVEGVKKTTLFHFKEHASQSSIREDVGIFVASSYGCCDSTDTHAIYSLKNGRRLFFAGGDRAPYVLDVSWPNTDRARLVGVHVAGSSRDPEVYKGVAADERHGRILVSLASTAGLFEALALLFDSAISDTPRVIAVDWAVSTDMKVYERQLEVWPPKKGQKPAIPVVQIALSSGQKISIPLDGDRFGNVSKPDGVQVIRLAPPQ